MNPTLWRTKAGLHLRSRAVWACLFAGAALVARAVAPSPPPRSPEGVAAMLGAAVGGEVKPDDFVWEARGGSLHDAFLGRSVLFLARPPGGGPADLYRARVRVTRGGQPLSLSSVKNLTRSAMGDDRDLVASGHHAAYVTTAFGAVQGITLLDLTGEGDAREARGFVDRTASQIESWISTGSTAGIGRTEITFAAPPPEARHELQGDMLVMALGEAALPAALDTRDGNLNTGTSNPFAAAVQRIPHHALAAGAVLVDLTRELLGDTAAGGARAVVGAFDRIAARVRPPKLAPLAMPEGNPAEGVWIDGQVKPTGNAPAPLLEMVARPDPGHPEALVRLVQIDTRQLDLKLAAGVDEPRSPSGLHGKSSVPKGAIAAFPAGPAEREAIGGEPGFVVDYRTFVPPREGLATVAIAADGKVQLGPWSEVFAHPTVRQTPDAILGWNGAAKRPLLGGGEPGERGALGLRSDGQLVYAWGTQVRAETLAKALSTAGCSYAVPLSTGAAGLTYEPAPARANDLFYLVPRRAVPPVTTTDKVSFAPDPGTQPSPAWLPAVLAATVVSVGAQVKITTFAPGRLSFHIRAGGREPATKAVAALPTTLQEMQRAHLIAALGLGSGKRKGARGLIIEGAVGLPIRSEESGALVIDHGHVRVARASEAKAAAGIDAAELPLLADEGKLRSEASDVGTMRPRLAACSLEDGTFAVAQTTFDSDEATTTALLDLGCARVVALDRGSHQPAFMHRAGGESPPEERYEASVLYAIEVPLSGRAGPLTP